MITTANDMIPTPTICIIVRRLDVAVAAIAGVRSVCVDCPVRLVLLEPLGDAIAQATLVAAKLFIAPFYGRCDAWVSGLTSAQASVALDLMGTNVTVYEATATAPLVPPPGVTLHQMSPSNADFAAFIARELLGVNQRHVVVYFSDTAYGVSLSDGIVAKFVAAGASARAVKVADTSETLPPERVVIFATERDNAVAGARAQALKQAGWTVVLGDAFCSGRSQDDWRDRGTFCVSFRQAAYSTSSLVLDSLLNSTAALNAALAKEAPEEPTPYGGSAFVAGSAAGSPLSTPQRQQPAWHPRSPPEGPSAWPALNVAAFNTTVTYAAPLALFCDGNETGPMGVALTAIKSNVPNCSMAIVDGDNWWLPRSAGAAVNVALPRAGSYTLRLNGSSVDGNRLRMVECGAEGRMTMRDAAEKALYSVDCSQSRTARLGLGPPCGCHSCGWIPLAAGDGTPAARVEVLVLQRPECPLAWMQSGNVSAQLFFEELDAPDDDASSTNLCLSPSVIDFPCREPSFRCVKGRQLCNGVADCPDGSDEAGCGDPREASSDVSSNSTAVGDGGGLPSGSGCLFFAGFDPAVCPKLAQLKNATHFLPSSGGCQLVVAGGAACAACENCSTPQQAGYRASISEAPAATATLKLPPPPPLAGVTVPDNVWPTFVAVSFTVALLCGALRLTRTLERNSGWLRRALVIVGPLVVFVGVAVVVLVLRDADTVQYPTAPLPAVFDGGGRDILAALRKNPGRSVLAGPGGYNVLLPFVGVTVRRDDGPPSAAIDACDPLSLLVADASSAAAANRPLAECLRQRQQLAGDQALLWSRGDLVVASHFSGTAKVVVESRPSALGWAYCTVDETTGEFRDGVYVDCPGRRAVWMTRVDATKARLAESPLSSAQCASGATISFSTIVTNSAITFKIDRVAASSVSTFERGTAMLTGPLNTRVMDGQMSSGQGAAVTPLETGEVPVAASAIVVTIAAIVCVCWWGWEAVATSTQPIPSMTASLLPATSDDWFRAIIALFAETGLFIVVAVVMQAISPSTIPWVPWNVLLREAVMYPLVALFIVVGLLQARLALRDWDNDADCHGLWGIRKIVFPVLGLLYQLGQTILLPAAASVLACSPEVLSVLSSPHCDLSVRYAGMTAAALAVILMWGHRLLLHLQSHQLLLWDAAGKAAGITAGSSWRRAVVDGTPKGRTAHRLAIDIAASLTSASLAAGRVTVSLALTAVGSALLAVPEIDEVEAIPLARLLAASLRFAAIFLLWLARIGVDAERLQNASQMLLYACVGAYAATTVITFIVTAVIVLGDCIRRRCGLAEF